MGRLKGAKNRITSDLKQRISDIVESELTNIDELLSELSAKDKASFLLGLMSYAISKPKAEQKLSLQTLTDSQAEYLTQKLLDEI